MPASSEPRVAVTSSDASAALRAYKKDRKSTLFQPLRLGAIEAPNRIVMAPMTRARGTRDHVQTAMMAAYYAQRASAGLIISEAIGISQQGLGRPYATGLWSSAQVAGWCFGTIKSVISHFASSWLCEGSLTGASERMSTPLITFVARPCEFRALRGLSSISQQRAMTARRGRRACN